MRGRTCGDANAMLTDVQAGAQAIAATRFIVLQFQAIVRGY
ncbi:MAG: hypothetical protein AAGF28_01540 [Pseudomonadota bacterium]